MVNASGLKFDKAKIDHDVDGFFDRTKGRDYTDEERKELEALEKSLADVEKKLAQAQAPDQFAEALRAITGGDDHRIVLAQGRELKSIGEQFTSAEAFETWRKDHRQRSARTWESPIIEVKATLTEDPASGGGLVIPAYQPGIVPTPLPPTRVMDLLAQGLTQSNSVVYMEETAYDNTAAPTAEGTAKPESAMTFLAVTEPVRKVAHWIPASEEILEDVPALSSYINARLRLGVLVAFDTQILSGNGVAPNLNGILNRAGLAAPVALTAPDTNADAILRQMSAIETATNIRPDGIVMNPLNWTSAQLVKSTTGEYIGATPFDTPQQPTLWGVPVALTPKIAAGTALVGSFRQAAQLFLRGLMMVQFSNSHQDYFIKNLIAIRAEQRGALAVYRPQAFGTVTGLK